MRNLALSCLLPLLGVACASSATPGNLAVQPAPSVPAPLATTCACGGDKTAPDHATGCPCAGHQNDHDHHTCGCGTGADTDAQGATPTDS